MKLLTEVLRARLIANGLESAATDKTIDHKPVVKFFSPVGAATWLISEIVPGDDSTTTMFGLCDLGMGDPELGYVSLEELQGVVLRFGLRIERDLHWRASKTIGEYAAVARQKGGIVA